VKTKPFQARQGDILITEKKDLDPSKLAEVRPTDGALVVAVGESSGHRHQLLAKGAKLFARSSVASLIDITAKGGALLEVTTERGDPLPHIRHGAIPLHKGRFEVRRQKEWSAERERQVQD
jgi:hypothetical protein